MMNSLSPEELPASRVFLTEFDRIRFSQVAWTPDDVAELEWALQRKVKLLLLVKAHVVIPASHLLESELARKLFLAQPRLLSSGAIVPSLRSDRGSATEFLEAKRDHSDPEEASLYASAESAEVAQIIDTSGTVVRWDPGDSTGWYRSRLVADLEDSGSLISLALRNAGLVAPNEMIRSIEEQADLSRGVVYRIAKATGIRELWSFVSEYADFLYYLGGARSTCSEGVLPQENLMDFSITDLAGGRTRLNEYDVFFKLLVDIIKAATSTHFPADFLDSISIDDAIDLHAIAVDRKFVEKYNAIQRRIKEGLAIRDPERLVLALEELATFEGELQIEFQSAIDRELPARLEEERHRAAAGFLHALASLVIPYYDAIGSAKEIVVSGLRLAGKDAVEHEIGSRIAAGFSAANDLVDRRSLNEKPILVAFVEALKRRYKERMFVQVG